jgi:hypothetical protein
MSLYPRSPWLRSELCCLDPSSLTTTPSVSPMGTLRLHDPVAYTQRLRCAGVPRRPLEPSLLSLPCFPSMPSTLPRWPASLSHCFRSAVPDFLELLASRRPQSPSLPAISDGVTRFRGCIVRFMLRPVCLPSPPDWLQHNETTYLSPCLLRYIVTSAFGDIQTSCRWKSG